MSRNTTSALAQLGALAFAAVALGAGCGGSKSPAVTTTPPEPAEVSQHWSGYMMNGPVVSFTLATGTWTVPKATCTVGDADRLSAVWVGLGGYTPGSQTLEQVGTDSNCNTSGGADYFAWFEVLPDISHTIPLKVSAGDTITGTVKILNANLIEFQVRNRTRRWEWHRKIPATVADDSSAEWIVEAPYACSNGGCRQAPLTNFGSVRIHDISTIGNGRRGTLATTAWTRTPLHFIPCTRILFNGSVSSRAAAKPRTPSADGTQFTIGWIRDIGETPLCRSRSDSVTTGPNLPPETNGPPPGG